jgi:hypothetical protein
MLTKAAIVELLKTDDRAVARALIVLTARQTADEQTSEHTRYLNGRGFRPCHARMGTSMANFFRRMGYLSPKQIAYWRKVDKSGSMRIGIYAGQLLEEAQLKAERNKVVTPKSEERDLGNDMERKMVLEEALGDVLDSDDPAVINPIKNEIDAIDAFWNKIRGQQP